MQKYSKYEPGMKFGKLTLIERVVGGQKWICECECGEKVITQIAKGSRECRKCAYNRISGEILVHGESGSRGMKSRLYNTWINMRARCNNKNRKDYARYGGRGIKVCDEWGDYLVFKKWAMESGYAEDLEIDRIDNNGNYEPVNCRWATRAEQMENTSRTHFVEIYGESKSVMSWCKHLGIFKTNAYAGAKRKGITIEEHLKYMYEVKNGMRKRSCVKKNRPELQDIPGRRTDG